MAETENQTAADKTQERAALQEFGKKLLTYGVWAFGAVASVLLLSIIIGAFMTSQSNEAVDFIRVNKSIQVTMSMICGLLFAFFGVALSWAGIRGSFSGAIDSGKLSTTINTASPGIVMMICGTVLIAIAVTREVHTETTGNPDAAREGTPSRKSDQKTAQTRKPDRRGTTSRHLYASD